jgi:hypothetical protein
MSPLDKIADDYAILQERSTTVLSPFPFQAPFLTIGYSKRTVYTDAIRWPGACPLPLGIKSSIYQSFSHED